VIVPSHTSKFTNSLSNVRSIDHSGLKPPIGRDLDYQELAEVARPLHLNDVSGLLRRNRLHFNEVIAKTSVGSWAMWTVPLNAEFNFRVEFAQLPPNLEIPARKRMEFDRGIHEGFKVPNERDGGSGECFSDFVVDTVFLKVIPRDPVAVVPETTGRVMMCKVRHSRLYQKARAL